MNRPESLRPLLLVSIGIILSAFLPAQSIVGDTIFGTGNGFGNSLDYAANGTFVIVGHPSLGGEGLEAGSATVYQLSGDAWLPVGESFTGAAPFDRLGSAVAVSGDGRRVAVGISGADDGGDNTGTVRVYDWSGSNWEQVGADLSGTKLNEQFGARLSMSDDGRRLAVGSVTFDADAGPRTRVGRTQVYELVGGEWTLLGREIQGENAMDGPQLEISLSAEGDHLAVASSWNGSTGFQSGHVRVFAYNDTIWEPQGFELVGAGTNDLFGASVALSADGQRMAVGALASLGRATSPGYVRVFDYDASDTTWTQVANLTGEARLDFFGTSVALSDDGKTLIAGATGNDANGDASGQARIYEEETTGNWVQVGNSINGAERGFVLGAAVGISGDGARVAVSVPFGRSVRPGEAGQVLVFDVDGVVRTTQPVIGELGVYPNPVSGSFIQLALPAGVGFERYELYDAQGRLVRGYAGGHARLAVSGLPTGAYVLFGYGPGGVFRGRVLRQ